MGSRRENRSSGAGPTASLHSKHHHEKRNQELLRLASDTISSYPVSHSTTAKTPPSRGGAGLMSKSLTLEVGKDFSTGKRTLKKSDVEKTFHKKSDVEKSFHKKSDVEKSLKSFQRQTSRGSSKMSHSLNEKDMFTDNKTSRIREVSPSKGKSQVPNNHLNKTTNRKRDSMTGKPLPSPTSDKKGGLGAGENIKRADVFERLTRQDCNKGVTRSEHVGPVGNRIRDRSPTKTGRKSPQEKNVVSDRHQRNRKSTSGDVKSAQPRKRDTSPMKKDDNKRIGSSSSTPGPIVGRRKIIPERLNHDLEEDKDGSREKLEKDNVPESSDKDLEDSTVGDDGDKTSADCVSVVLQDNGGDVVGRKPVGVGVGGGSVSKKAAEKGKLGHRATSQGVTCGTKVTPSIDNTHSLQSTNRDKVDKGAVKTASPVSDNLAKNPIRHKPMVIDTSPAELSKADVMKKVRQRVPNDSRRDTKDVVDDDKDVCETEKCDEDDFYKIKVQTRLVSYSNSTLVIKNTSKSSSVGDLTSGEGVGEGGSPAKDTGVDSSHPPPPHSPTSSSQPHTLQTSSSVPPTAAGMPPSGEVEPEGGASTLPTEAHHQKCSMASEGERDRGLVGENGEPSPFTRSQSMRLKLSQFVCKGKNFLTDVYSATQNKLEQYTRNEFSPTSSMTSSVASTTGVLENEINITLHAPLLPNDSDSGYYSISTSLEKMHPVSTEENLSLACASRGVQGAPSSGFINEEVEESVTAEMSTEDEVLPEPPAPHVNFKLNDEWIKKNILCTCKCKRNISKMAVGQNSASQSSEGKVNTNTVVDTDVLAPKEAEPNTECDSVSLTKEESDSKCVSENVEIDVEVTNDLDDDLCLCSCHEGEDGQQLQTLPKEIQELLDADHARMWWTITGNFGNILPIDWSKTYTRQQYLPVLNLNEAKAMRSPSEEVEKTADEEAEEEEEVAQDLDLHHLILNGLSAEPVKSAEEVIKEIDDLMQEGSSSEDEGVEEASSSGVNANEPVTQPLPPPLYAAKLNNMSIGELNESFMELEVVIQQYSETLINQLALRDELEYEKELKNSFISLLLQVQNKRRNFNVEKKKQKKYLTTVIPYDVGHGPPQNETLQILIKILMAINEDSPTVPTLLTDYILKVLCPS